MIELPFIITNVSSIAIDLDVKNGGVEETKRLFEDESYNTDEISQRNLRLEKMELIKYVEYYYGVIEDVKVEESIPLKKERSKKETKSKRTTGEESKETEVHSGGVPFSEVIESDERIENIEK